MVANVNLLRSLPGNANTFMLLDAWRKVGLGFNRVCLLFNRNLAVGESGVWWCDYETVGPTPTPGSTKAGVAIEHPEWTILGGRQLSFVKEGSDPGLYRTTFAVGSSDLSIPARIRWTDLFGETRFITPDLEWPKFPLVTGSVLNCGGRYPL